MTRADIATRIVEMLDPNVRVADAEKLPLHQSLMTLGLDGVWSITDDAAKAAIAGNLRSALSGRTTADGSPADLSFKCSASLKQALNQ